MELTFQQRIGLKPASKVLQISSIDDDLRNSPKDPDFQAQYRRNFVCVRDRSK